MTRTIYVLCGLSLLFCPAHTFASERFPLQDDRNEHDIPPRKSDEVVLYHSITAEPVSLKLEVAIDSPIGTGRLFISKSAASNRLKSLRFEIDGTRASDVSPDLLQCIEGPIIAETSVSYTVWGGRTKVPNDHYRRIKLPFYGNEWAAAYKSEPDKLSPLPIVVFQFAGDELTNITFQNRLYENRSLIAASLHECPTDVIDWALAVPDTPPTDE